MTAAAVALVRTAATRRSCDLERVRRDFPILARTVHGQRLVFLDSAASAQKPRAVIDAIEQLLRSRVRQRPSRRLLAERARDPNGSKARASRVRRFLNAARKRGDHLHPQRHRGHQPGGLSLGAGSSRPATRSSSPRWSTIPTSCPGSCCATAQGIVLKVAPINDAGEFLLDEYAELLSAAHQARGGHPHLQCAGHDHAARRHHPARHGAGAQVLIDGSQAAPHRPVDVQALDCDFFVFTGHKVYGPSGIGVLYGKADLLRRHAALSGRRRHDPLGHLREDRVRRYPATVSRPARPISPAPSAWQPPIDYVTALGFDRIDAPRAGAAALRHASGCLTCRACAIVGRRAQKASIVSFTLEGAHPHDIGTILDRQGVAVRAGHHCAQPLMDRFGRGRNGARLLRLVQRLRRCRCAGRRPAAGCGRSSADVRSARTLPGGHPRPQPPAAELPQAGRRPTARPRATIRSAATGSPST